MRHLRRPSFVIGLVALSSSFSSLTRADVAVTPLGPDGRPAAEAPWVGKTGWFLRDGYYALKVQLLPPAGAPKPTPDTFELTSSSARLQSGGRAFMAQRTDPSPLLAVDPGCTKRGITVAPAGGAPRLVGNFLYLAARCEDRPDGQIAVLLSLSQDGPIEQSRFVPAAKVRQERNRLEALIGADAPKTWGVIALQGNRVQLGRAVAGSLPTATPLPSSGSEPVARGEPRSYSLWGSLGLGSLSFHQEPGSPDAVELSHLALFLRLGASGRVANDKVDLSAEAFVTALTLSSSSKNGTSLDDYPAARYLGGTMRAGYRFGSGIQFTPSLGATYATMMVGTNAAGTAGSYGLNTVIGAELRFTVSTPLVSTDPRRPYHGVFLKFSPMLAGSSIGPSNRDLGFGGFVQLTPRRWGVKLSLVAEASLLNVTSGENQASWSMFTGGLQIGY